MQALADEFAERLKPQSTAYHDIWLTDGETGETAARRQLGERRYNMRMCEFFNSPNIKNSHIRIFAYSHIVKTTFNQTSRINLRKRLKQGSSNL